MAHVPKWTDVTTWDFNDDGVVDEIKRWCDDMPKRIKELQTAEELLAGPRAKIDYNYRACCEEQRDAAKFFTDNLKKLVGMAAAGKLPRRVRTILHEGSQDETVAKWLHTSMDKRSAELEEQKKLLEELKQRAFAVVKSDPSSVATVAAVPKPEPVRPWSKIQARPAAVSGTKGFG
jgi:hypothetical protein